MSVGAVTTAASLLLNFLHGYSVIRADGLTSGSLHPLLVLIITSLPVGAIGFGSHLRIACVRNFRSRVPRTGEESEVSVIERRDQGTTPKALGSDGPSRVAGRLRSIRRVAVSVNRCAKAVANTGFSRVDTFHGE